LLIRRRTKLIFWRIENGLKQVDIIRRLGITSGYYSNIEKARVDPSFKLLVKFKDIFEIDDVIDLFEISEREVAYGNDDTSGNFSKE
jgi:transcriptional regulator with XRE-family HTH domain